MLDSNVRGLICSSADEGKVGGVVRGYVGGYYATVR